MIARTTHRYQMPDRAAPAMPLDYDAIRNAADGVIAEEAARLLTDDECVLSFVKLIQWDREEALIAAITVGDAETVGAAVLLRLNEIAQECAEEEWTK